MDSETATACKPSTRSTVRRRLPVGAEVQSDGVVHFRVWAPQRSCVEVLLEDDCARPGNRSSYELPPEGNGYFSGLVTSARAGALYRYRLDEAHAYPDPASRHQPQGPHGPSRVIDPGAFHWTDAQWRGITRDGQVIYEMHIGTFTPEGTWDAASRQLRELADLGITIVEIMPIAEFCGRFGWGYDGVDLFAPSHLYGTPDDLRAFVDRAHAARLGVILDVVYNHVGPDGDYLQHYSPDYFTDRYENEWGRAINFDGDNAAAVREFFVANAGYWIDEFHLDGLRLDATQQIFDSSPVHILEAIAQRVRQKGHSRSTIVIAENEPQEAKLVRSSRDSGYGLDALWNDDFHHSALVALTGRSEAYYSDYLGTPQEIISTVKRGFLYQGQHYSWQNSRRGTPALDLSSSSFVCYLQNHDQIANSASGLRVHELASPGRIRALTALLLLAPSTPMLFQGQEFAASSPFLFFADHKADLAAAVRKGRAQFMSQFPSVATPAVQERLPPPDAFATFDLCKLDFGERESHAAIYALHRDLLRLRRSDAVFAAQRTNAVDGAVLASEALVLRFFGPDAQDRLLLINLGRDLRLCPLPEPLLAPPLGGRWATLWSSEDPKYGGGGAVDVESNGSWRIPGHAALVLAPVPATA